MGKPLKIRLHVLSPLHIGCDDVYEPTSFVIDEQKKKLIQFDPMDFVKGLAQQERDEFSKLCSQDSLLPILKFVKRVFNQKINGRSIDIAGGLADHYKKAMDNKSIYSNKDIINQFSIQRTVYNPQDNQPYIPGTSLKGAFRTAYLSALATVRKIDKFWIGSDLLSSQDLANPEFVYKQIGRKGVAKKLEEKLFNGSFDSDPFRMVKISDMLPLGNVAVKVVYAVNKKKKKSDKATRAESGPPQILETILAEGIFEGAITIQMPEHGSGIKDPIRKEYLLKSAQRFYEKVLSDEKVSFQALGVNHPYDHAYFKQFLDKFNKTAFLVRLGRHSGAEAVTIDDNRYIKIMQKKGEPDKYLDHATTLWLASDSPRPQNNNDLQPFGWAVLEILPFDVKEGIYSAKKQPDLKPVQNIDTNTSEPVLPKKQVTIIPAETILWENAILAWSPGNQTLKATKESNKAELKLGPDKSIVPEKYHEVLFTKKKEIAANISIEKTGNAFKIVGIS